MKKALLLLTAGLLVMGSPVSQIYSATVTQDNVEVTVTKDKVASDDVVLSRVKEAFAKAPAVPGTVDIKVEKGVVTLKGHVFDAKVKADFEARAKGVAGVDKVVNDLVVKPVAPVEK